MPDSDIYKESNEGILSALDFNLPTGFLSFISSNNIVYDGENYSYLSNCGDYLYAAARLVEVNSEYRVDEFYPSYFLIGSNGGGEAYAIEKATGRFIITPFIGHDEETSILVGQTWPEFFKYLRDNDS
jgi:hypothetical protein